MSPGARLIAESLEPLGLVTPGVVTIWLCRPTWHPTIYHFCCRAPVMALIEIPRVCLPEFLTRERLSA